jgi:rod shape determining protein RodA
MSTFPYSSALDRVERRQRTARNHVDWTIVVVAIGLCGFGLLNIYAARKQNFEVVGGDTAFYVKRQILAMGIGFAGAIAIALIDYRKLRVLTPVAYLAIVGLLGAVLIGGSKVKGARAWFDVGPFQLQPSEFAKVAVIVVIATLGAATQGRLSAKLLVASLILAAIPAGLVLLQPDLGTAMVLAAIVLGTLLVAGAQARHIVLITVAALGLTVFVLQTDRLHQYQKDRLTSFIDPRVDVSAQTAQQKKLKEVIDNVEGSKAAIATGGWSGAGLFQGPLTNQGAVPEQRTDFIFSVVGEQFGFLGTAGLLGVYALLGFRIWRTAAISRDLFGTLICAGALSMLVFQVFENIGMSMGIMPVTGIPLPLLSYGGSSTIAFLLLLGLVVNVHMHRYSA